MSPDIAQECVNLAADAQQVKYESRVQFALLDAAIEIKRLRALLDLNSAASERRLLYARQPQSEPGSEVTK